MSQEKQGDKTMRRHVENQIESGEGSSLGILVLCMLWVLALMALSTAAHGEDRPAEQTAIATARTLGDHLDAIRTDPASPASPADGAQRRFSAHHLQVSPAKNENPPQDAESNETVTLPRFILISIPDRQLALVDDGQVIKIYPIAVGANHTPSPDGYFTVISHVSNPTWTHKGKVVAPGKSNPVGSRWMGLSRKGYGIHGTNAPRSIGKAASHGCFRMGKKDIEELFTLVRLGDTVVVRAERDDLVTQVFGTANSGEVQVASAAAASVDADEENR